jgi:hypothetical protein
MQVLGRPIKEIAVARKEWRCGEGDGVSSIDVAQVGSE